MQKYLEYFNANDAESIKISRIDEMTLNITRKRLKVIYDKKMELTNLQFRNK